MKPRFVSAVVLAFVLGVALSQSPEGRTETSGNDPRRSVGRYHPLIYTNVIFALDTSTGVLWRYNFPNNLQNKTAGGRAVGYWERQGLQIPIVPDVEEPTLPQPASEGAGRPSRQR